MLMLLLSIGPVTSRSLSIDDWQRPAGTGSNVILDALLPCVESTDCRGRVFGSHSEDVSKFGNVPPCRSYGWVRCIQHADPSIADSTHSRQVPPTKYYYHQQKNTPVVEPYRYAEFSSADRSRHQDYANYPSKVPAQAERSSEAARYAAANNQRIIELQSFARQQDEDGRNSKPHFVDESLEIPAAKREKFNMGVFPFQTSILPTANKQSLEYVWGNQASQRDKSPGLSRPTERPVEFHHGQQRFEQSSQQLINPSKFTQQKNKELLPSVHQSGQHQLTQTDDYAFLDNDWPQPSSQQNKAQQPLKFQQFADEHGQKRMETRTFGHHPESSQQEIVDVIQRFVKVNQKPVDVLPVSLQTAELREESNRIFQVPQRIEPIQQNRKLVDPGQRVMDSQQFVEPPVQRKLNEPQQGLVLFNQPLTEGHLQQFEQFTGQPNVEPHTIQRPVEFQLPPKPIVQQPISFEKKQQSPLPRPLHHVKETVEWVTEPPRLPQTTVRLLQAESRRLEQPAVEPSSLIKSTEFIEPAKSSLESLLIRFNSAKDTQQADEQLTALLRFLALPSNQPAGPEEMLAETSDSAPPFIGKHESNVVPFIAFSEPLPLEANSNSLF